MPLNQALHELLDHSDALIEALPDAIFFKDGHGRWRVVNRVGLRAFGLEDQDWVGKTDLELAAAHPHLAPALRTCAERDELAWTQTGRSEGIEYVADPVSGEIQTYEVIRAPIFNDDGGRGGLVVIGRNVSEQKQAEQALRNAKNYAENLIATANVMIVELDLEGRVQLINPAAQQLTGYTEEEVLGQDWFALLMTLGRYPEVLKALSVVQARGCLENFETPIQTKAGEKRHITWRNNELLHDGELVGTVFFGMDVTARRLAEKELIKKQVLLNEAQRIGQVGSWEHDLSSRTLTWSDETFRILEIDPTRQAASYEAFLATVEPADLERVKRIYTHSLKHRMPYEIKHRLRLPGGITKYVQQHGETLVDEQGVPSRAIGTIQDITLATLNEMALRDSEDRFRTIADFTYDWEYWLGDTGEIVYMTPSCERITGYSAIEFTANPNLINEIIHPDDRHIMDGHQEQMIASETEAAIDFRIIRKDGGIRWIGHACRPVFSQGKEFAGRRVSNRDITDRKLAEEAVHRLAYFDSLTQLPNRRMMEDRLRQGLALAVRHQRALAVMFLDLDHFKQVNDTLGHHMGDALLQIVASRLNTCVRLSDTVARSGGDEFVVILPEISQPDDAIFVARKMIEALAEPVVIGEHRLTVTTSIGIAVHPIAGTDDSQELMRRADMAMYDAKRGGRNNFSVYRDPEVPPV